MIQQIKGAPQDQQITQEKQTAVTSSAKETDSFQSLLQAASDLKTTVSCKNSGENSQSPSQGEKVEAQAGEKKKTGNKKSATVLAQVNILLDPTVQQQPNANVSVPVVQSQISAEQPPFTGAKTIQPVTVLQTAGQASVQKNVLTQGAENLVQQGTAKSQPNLQQKAVMQDASKNIVEAQAVPESRQPATASENISQMLPVRQGDPSTGSEVQQAVNRSTCQAAEQNNGLTQVSADTSPAKADTGFELSAELKGNKFQVHTFQSGQKEKTDSSSQNAASETRKISNFYSDGKIVVKISDTPAKAKIPVNQQISSAVMLGIKAGKHQIQVDLYPQSLGKVSVKLMSENGLLTVEIAASNSKTQSLLASSSDEIKSMLQVSTNQTVQVTHPEQEARQYAQRQDQPTYQQENQQQEQKEKSKPKWYAIRSTDEISTGDFLSLIERTSAAV